MKGKCCAIVASRSRSPPSAGLAHYFVEYVVLLISNRANQSKTGGHAMSLRRRLGHTRLEGAAMVLCLSFSLGGSIDRKQQAIMAVLSSNLISHLNRGDKRREFCMGLLQGGIDGNGLRCTIWGMMITYYDEITMFFVCSHVRVIVQINLKEKVKD